MDIHVSEYEGSFPNHKICPAGNFPEFAFIGRSNVGKSSLINMLCHRNELAHTSKKPGKTQMLNFYRINSQWRLVDLPGYGYAIVSKAQRKTWEKMIQDYLVLREQLECAFVLIDSNVSPQKKDLEFINWLGSLRIPFVLVFTKADRSKPEEIARNVEAFGKAMLETWNELPRQFITSSTDKAGRDELLDYIASIIAEVSAH
ncbi:MAG: YihA family ribosome biogenesis GTP-binding protein [Haliscomenobacter sp.]|nr:YihA family ribosome biogenesis GTP-binding protein [Haliscomenobacter sp.]MBP9077276.1 YihA family ribosome biogenesis GTP-binding protein [Haliscomenobacter sp.]